MKVRIGGVFIPVTNLEKSIEWYMKCLPLELVDRWQGEAGAGFRFRSGGAGLMLVQVDKSQPTEFDVSERQKNCYFNFNPESIHEFHRELQEKGVEVTEIEDHGTMLGFDFFDPDGNPFSAVLDLPSSKYYVPFD